MLELDLRVTSDRRPRVQGLRAQARGQGASLLGALIEEAWRRGAPALSSSVEPTNPAIELYTSLGFVVLCRVDGAATMVLKRMS